MKFKYFYEIESKLTLTLKEIEFVYLLFKSRNQIFWSFNEKQLNKTKQLRKKYKCIFIF